MVKKKRKGKHGKETNGGMIKSEKKKFWKLLFIDKLCQRS